jgi:hypothetical protein
VGAVLVGMNIRGWRDRLFTRSSRPQIQALAVLPLTNLSGDPEQEYFADGIDILAAIKREERKLEKQLHKLQHKLNGVRAAAKALGDSTSKEIKGVKKRVLSAAGRAAIAKAAKKRWAKFRAQAKKVAG